MKLGIPYLVAPADVDVEHYVAARFSPHWFGYRVLEVSVHQGENGRVALLEIRRFSGRGKWYGDGWNYVRLKTARGEPFPESALEQAAMFYFQFLPLLSPAQEVVFARGKEAVELAETLSTRIGAKLRPIRSLRGC